MKARKVTRVLLVDDERELCDLFGMMLENHGFQTALSHSGNEACARLDHYTPDVIVTDFRMPHGSGLLVVEKARAKNIPVIVVSGFIDAATDTALKDVTVLRKPINFGDLLNAIEKAVG